ncbi:unnamed protein product [Lactuca virosa]|uniref:Folylpolyglutamate synthase n=1 Tax=Lactuca virosa TaxID=75947 RepID=A0AAU9N165_9ASTR|nr:unnamed protein product [Lactuca virosa]
MNKKCGDDIPMPTLFRFLALLAFKIFAAEQVDVAVMEVGLGGKTDATNVVQTPIVCGITPLGYDHTEVLGNTLGEIAGEKAGIFKKGVPAFTVSQPEEAMQVLKEKASRLDVNLEVANMLDSKLLNGLHLGLAGDHQYINAGLAIMLSSTWLQRTGHLEVETSYLSERFIKGLASANLQGRAQIIHDKQGGDNSRKDSAQILLFNCMSVRDPQLLFPRLVDTCGGHGVKFKKAIFVPNMSVYNKVGSSSSSLPQTDLQQVDNSWQLTLGRVWENTVCSEGETGTCESKNSMVFSSLPLAIKWLRDTAKQNTSVQLQVLVTGSLHLVGDVMKLVNK